MTNQTKADALWDTLIYRLNMLVVLNGQIMVEGMDNEIEDGDLPSFGFSLKKDDVMQIVDLPQRTRRVYGYDGERWRLLFPHL